MVKAGNLTVLIVELLLAAQYCAAAPPGPVAPARPTKRADRGP